MKNKVNSSGLILTNIILTTDATIGWAMSDTWCQMVWHLIPDARPHTYPMLLGVDTYYEPLCATLSTMRGGVAGERVYLSWTSEVLNEISSYTDVHALFDGPCDVV